MFDNKLYVAILVVVVLLLVYYFWWNRENATSMQTSAGGPDNVIRSGVLASGPDRELELPSRSRASPDLPTIARAYPFQP